MAIKVKQVQCDDGSDMEVKRFYIPGVTLSSRCPKCRKTAKRDLGEDYLSHPRLNVPIDYHFCCDGRDGCNAEWTEQIVVRITVEAAPEKG